MSFAEHIARLDRIAIDAFGDKDGNGSPEVITYTPEDGDPVSETPGGETLTGIFSELYELAHSTADAGVDTLGPAVFFRLSDLPVDPQDDEPTITIRGDDYAVTRREPDGMGGIVLGLRKLS